MPFKIRPGTSADLDDVTRVYLASFGPDPFMPMMHPKREEYPDDYALFFYRTLHRRYWGDEEQIFNVMVHEPEPEPSATPSSPSLGEPCIVGFIWFRRPWQDQNKRAAHEGWLTPRAWIKPLVNGYRNAGEYIWPCRSADPNMSDAFVVMHDSLEKKLAAEDPSPPRREKGWYLSSLGVVPQFQGKGLGGMLVRNALEEVVDREGAVCWLVGTKNAEPFYERLGFKNIGRGNQGALASWEGGGIMMRE